MILTFLFGSEYHSYASLNTFESVFYRYTGLLESLNLDTDDDSLNSRVQKWNAAKLWSESISNNLKLENNAIVLAGNVLVEDDAAGIGSIRDAAWDTLSANVVFRKYLNIVQVPAKDALIAMMLYPVAPTEPLDGGKLEFSVNGNAPIIYEVRHFWTSVPVPIKYLKAGENIIDVKVHGKENRYRIPVALHANFQYGSSKKPPLYSRSERSANDGKTWIKYQAKGLQHGGGEYPIRLKLETFQERGWLQTPVINLGEPAKSNVLLFPAKIDFASFLSETVQDMGSKWEVRMRSGKTHQPEAGGWTEWKVLVGRELPTGFNDRFIQLEFSFGQNSNQLTPKILGLQVQSTWHDESPERKRRIIAVNAQNQPISRSSFSFEYEDPANAELQNFRKRFELDKVVAGSLTEWEKIRKLRGWVAGSWDWFLPNSNLDDLLKWDASEILAVKNKLSGQQNKGGNCTYYAIVFAQACQSFGIPARIISINFSLWGGHEIVEVWSRDYGKWIMIDPNFDTMFYDRKNGIPLNGFELHKYFLKTYYPNNEVIDRDLWSFEDRDKRSDNINPELLPIAIEVGGNAYSGKIKDDYVWWKVSLEKSNPGYSGGYGFFNTAELRWLPRSNWLSKPAPNPITHGRTHWGWDGYYIWTDSQTPETPEHRYYVRRESDMYGKLYTVDLSAEAITKDVLQVNLATVSPAFSYFEVIKNGLTKEVNNSTFDWKLVPGINILEVRSIDKLGNRGTKSSMEVNYIPISN